MTDFSTHEVAKILGLPDSKIRSCARAALLAPVRGPGGRLRWSFQDLLLLKTTRGLLEARVPPRRIRRMLASLRRQLPADQALSSVSIYADGRRAIAWDGTARWQPDSGQFLFSFDARAVAIPDAPSATRPAAVTPSPPPARSAEEWFDLACELDPASPDRLHHAGGDAAQAEHHYRAAIRDAPGDAIAHFNLAGLLEETGRATDAVAVYHQALAAEPDFADAHYNLGLLLDALGRRPAAMTHLRTARRLYARRSA